MKIIKRLSTVIAALFLSVWVAPILVLAVDGNISFSDPETAVGEMVEVKCAFRTTEEVMGDLTMRLKYDKAALRFRSGEGITNEGEGVLSYTGTSNTTEVMLSMTFQALTEGTTTISIESATVTAGDGTTLDMEYGSSAVTIGPGDPTKILPEEGEAAPTAAAGDKPVEVNGTSYNLSDKFADVDIPNGYARTTVSLDGEDRQMLLGDGNGVYLAFLVSGDGKGDFFVYNTEDSTFSPYEEVAISDMTTIVILSDAKNVNLPEHYQEANLTLNGKDFPVWQDNLHDGFYVMHAVSNTGSKGLYQYDTQEGTYQRIEIKEETPKEEEEVKDESFFGTARTFVDKYFKILLPAVAGLILLLILILLIVSVKLRNRNLELDDLYDEYDIDYESEPEDRYAKEERTDNKKKKEKKTSRAEDFDDEPFGEDFKKDSEEEELEVDFEEDDFPDRVSDEEPFEESLDSLDLDDVFSERKTAKYDTSGLALGDGENQSVFDEMRNDLRNDLKKEVSKKKSQERKKGHKKGESDLFDIDIIDLD